MKLIIVIIIMVLLGVLLGYIIGSQQLITTNPQNEDTLKTQQNTNELTAVNVNTLPSYDSLLASPTTSPLPLSLQAGVFYDKETANTSLKKLQDFNVGSTIIQFSDVNQQTLNVIILGPFENEAKLQLAQYKLSEMKITSQRVITPQSVNEN